MGSTVKEFEEKFASYVKETKHAKMWLILVHQQISLALTLKLFKFQNDSSQN